MEMGMKGSGAVEDVFLAAVADVVCAAPVDRVLHAHVNHLETLISAHCATRVDYQNYFMCWQATRLMDPTFVGLPVLVPPHVDWRQDRRKPTFWFRRVCQRLWMRAPVIARVAGAGSGNAGDRVVRPAVGGLVFGR